MMDGRGKAVSHSHVDTFASASLTTMSSATETAVALPVKKPKKLSKPARKQVKPGEVEKKETPQTGKEYSPSYRFALPSWLGSSPLVILQISGIINGQEEIVKTAIPSTYASLHHYSPRADGSSTVKPNLRPDATSNRTPA